MNEITNTRFADITPWKARLVLILLLFSMTYGLFHNEKHLPARHTSKYVDVDLYEQIIERVHSGEGYYSAAGSELRNRGYATRPFFNWRLPTLAWFLALFPTPDPGIWILTLLSLTAMVFWISVFFQEGSLLTAAAAILLYAGATAQCAVKPVFFFHEIWAGTCIALSLALYAQGCRQTGVVFGLAALFLRELTLPYIAVMLWAAYRDRQYSEVKAWLIGLAIFSVYLTIHAVIVTNLLNETDRANASWIQFGGWAFVLSVARSSPYLMNTPSWLNAVLVPLSLLGLASWKSGVGSRVAWTVGIYLLVFSIVGRVDNFYWGLLVSSFLPLGWIHAPSTLNSLIRNSLRTA